MTLGYDVFVHMCDIRTASQQSRTRRNVKERNVKFLLDEGPIRSKYWTSLSISTVHRLFRRIMETNIVYFLQTGGNQPKIHKPGNAQQAFFGHVTQGLTSVRSARDDLETSADLPPLGNDPVSLRLRRILNFTRVRRLIDKSKKKKTPIRNEG